MKKKINKVYETKIESDMSDPEKRLMELINGAEPRDEHEREMVREIEEASQNGQIISIPSN